MPRRSRTLLRIIGGSALVLAIAVVVSPDFMHGQTIAGREIDGTQFVVSTIVPPGVNPLVATRPCMMRVYDPGHLFGLSTSQSEGRRPG